MMKPIVMVLLLLGCTLSCYAEDKLPFEIQRIVDAKQRKIDEIERQYQTALRKQRETYIKRKDMTSAEIIDNMLGEIKTVEAEKEKTSKLAKVDCDAEFGRFRKGQPWYSNHPAVFYSVPDDFSGYKHSLAEVTCKTPLQITVKKAGIVTVICEQRYQQKLESKGWKRVDHAVFTSKPNRELPIFQKEFAEGEYTIPDTENFVVRLITK